MDIYDEMEVILRQTKLVQDAWEDGEWLMACRCMGRMADAYQELAAEFAQLAYDNGSTKKDIAIALGLSVSALSGMKKRTR